MENVIKDAYGRTMRKLRVQLTDACQLRCFYCMPDQPQFLPTNDLLSANEIENIVAALVPFGLREIRLTGGEPTVRKDFLEIARRLSPYAQDKYGLTTNALLLGKLLVPLFKETTLRSLNISLDTFNAQKFEFITRQKKRNAKSLNLSERVVNTILAARDMGFTVKINCILFKGLNDDEIMDFVKFSEREKIEVRFLEYMKIGPRYDEFKTYFISANAALETVRHERTLAAMSVAEDSTSFNFRTDGGGTIGFIASESTPFCNTCSRLRLTATGFLRSCLFSEKGLSVRNATESSSIKDKRIALEDTIRAVVAMKPTGRLERISQPMNEIGG